MTFNELLNSDILKDVLDNPNSLIYIDIDDIKDLFQQESEINAFNVKVDYFEEQRMESIPVEIMMKYANTYSEDEKRTIEQGLDLFQKHFCNLWD